MSGIVRIRCKTPPPPDGFGIRVRLMPTMRDCDVVLVGDDGVEEPIQGVTRASWSVEEGKVVEAQLTVIGVEIDAEGMLPDAEPEPCPTCGGLGRHRRHDGMGTGTDDPTQPACPMCKGSGRVLIRACVR